MKAVGIVRQVDDLGRIVIPKEVRRSLFIKEGDSLEIYTADNCIIFKKLDTRKNVADIIRDLRVYIDNDGCLGSNVALSQKIKELEAEVEKILRERE